MSDARSKEQIMNALITKPSKYYIKVLNDGALPKDIKKSKEILFEVRPPVLTTMTKVALVLNSLPEKAMDPNTPPGEAAMYADKLCEIIAIMSHGNSKKDMPDWYVKFLMDNLTPVELIKLVQEISLKTGTDFFLPSLQIAVVSNPMTMTSRKEARRMEGSTRTS